MQLSSYQFETGNLELLARQAVEGFIIGLHKSPFHGFSVEFAEHRLYNPGDNLRHIDWKVFGRRDKLFVKKYEEETNLRCCIALDVSASMSFGYAGGVSKIQFSALAAAAMMQLLKKQLDAAGMYLFSDKLLSGSAIKSSERHYKSLIAELEVLLSKPLTERGTNLPAVMHELAETLPRRGLVLIFSDFMNDLSQEEELYAALQHLRFMRQEVILFQVGDAQREWSFEFENRPYEFIDAETQERVRLVPADVKEAYLAQISAYHQRLEEHCLRYNIDLIRCDTHTNLNQILYSYLVKRNKMM